VNQDAFAEPDHIVPAEQGQVLVARLITERAIRKQGDVDVRRRDRMQPLDDRIFDLTLLSLEL
jgi:hypothetical protein